MVPSPPPHSHNRAEPVRRDPERAQRGRAWQYGRTERCAGGGGRAGPGVVAGVVAPGVRLGDVIAAGA